MLLLSGHWECGLLAWWGEVLESLQFFSASSSWNLRTFLAARLSLLRFKPRFLTISGDQRLRVVEIARILRRIVEPGHFRLTDALHRPLPPGRRTSRGRRSAFPWPGPDDADAEVWVRLPAAQAVRSSQPQAEDSIQLLRLLQEQRRGWKVKISFLTSASFWRPDCEFLYNHIFSHHQLKIATLN